jgi:hypothetical protein
MARRWRELAHLAGRFARSVRPPTVPDEDVAWARAWLRPAEMALWSAQAPVDRVHSVAVARAAVRGASTDGAPPWLAPAALLHDVGKVDAGLGALGRAVATVLELVGVHRAPGRLGRYLRYPETGAERLAAAGAAPEVVAWAREHHLPPASWTVPAPWAARLAAADRSAR